MKKESNNIATNNQVYVLCATQTLNPPKAENYTCRSRIVGPDFHHIGLIYPTR